MARELAEGAKAPAFTLPRDDGTRVSLKDFKGRNLVLYFYPKADTSGCTKEAIAFSGLKAAFAKAGTDILGVSADPVAALEKFKTKHKLTSAWPPTKPARCWQTMARGAKNRCMGANTWGFSARPS